MRFIKLTMLSMLMMTLGNQAMTQETEMTQENPGYGTAAGRYSLEFETVDFTPPEVKQETLGNGITLDTFHEPNLPLVTIIVRLDAGSLNDEPGLWGQGELTADVIRAGGTEEMPGNQLDLELENRGANLNVSVNRESTNFRISLLAEDLEWGMELLYKLISQPALPEEKMDEVRGPWMYGLQQRFDSPANIARDLYSKLLWGKDSPWGAVVTPKSLMSLTREDLARYHDKFYTADRIKVGVAGSFDPEEIFYQVDDQFGLMRSTMAPIEEVIPPQPIEEMKIYVVPMEATQNAIYFGHEGYKRHAEEHFDLMVFNSVLSGGFTSRLFREVRSNRGLAYGVSGRIVPGTYYGQFVNATQTKAESTMEALELMIDINEGLTEEPPTAEEVKIAVDSEVNSFVFNFDTPEKVLSQKMELDAKGYDDDFLTTWVDNLTGVTGESARAAADKYLHLDKMVVLVVGNISEELRNGLEEMGPITELTLDELREEWL